MLSIGRISPAAACCSPSSSSIIVRVVPALALRPPCDPMRYTPLRFANRENVGRVDHPEHHAQARPKWNGGYKLIVRLGATANKKEIAHNRAFCRANTSASTCTLQIGIVLWAFDVVTTEKAERGSTREPKSGCECARRATLKPPRWMFGGWGYRSRWFNRTRPIG
jgi:hypothetical protein